jgi:hypothetical protein
METKDEGGAPPDPPDPIAEKVPRIGRGRLVPRFPLNEIVRILMLITALVVIISMRSACGDGVANWFRIVAPENAADGGR